MLFLNKGLIRHPNIWKTLHFQGFNMDMGIWLSKVNGPTLSKERWIKLLLKKNGSEKKLLTIEASPHSQDSQLIIFETFLTIESQDTNRYPALPGNPNVNIFSVICRFTSSDMFYRRISNFACFFP